MTWIVILGVVALLLLLLLIPVRVSVDYAGEELTSALRWLFLRFPLWPRPEKKQAEGAGKGRKGKETAEPGKEKEKPGKQGFLDTLQGISDALPALLHALRRILRSVTLYRCRVTGAVAAGDAGDTAIRYGRAQALLYGIYFALRGTMKVREFAVDLRPDYAGEKDTGEIHAAARIRPISALAAAAGFLLRGGAAAFTSKKKTTDTGKAKVK